MCFYIFHSLVIRRCKSNDAIPTVDVTDTSFIAPRGVLFCRVVKSELLVPHEVLSTKEIKLTSLLVPLAFSC